MHNKFISRLRTCDRVTSHSHSCTYSILALRFSFHLCICAWELDKSLCRYFSVSISVIRFVALCNQFHGFSSPPPPQNAISIFPCLFFFTYWLPSTVIFSSMNSVKMEWPRIRKNNTQIEESNGDDEISIAFVYYYQNSAKLIYFYDILISRLYSINLTDFHECVGGKKRECY